MKIPSVRRSTILIGIGVLAGLAIIVFIALPRTRFQWRAGDRHMYSFEMNTHVVTRNLLTGMFGSFSQGISGTLNMKVLSAEEGAVSAVMQLHPVSVVMGEKNDPNMERLFSMVFMVTFDRSGKMKKLMFDNSISEEDEKMVANLVRALEVAVPGTILSTWKETGEDENGTFESRYKESKTNILKRKIAYVRKPKTRTRHGKDVAIRVARSAFRFQVDREGSWFTYLRGREQLEISEPQTKSVQVSTGIELDVARVPFEPDPGARIWSLSDSASVKRALAAGSKNPVSLRTEMRLAALDRQMGGVTLDKVLAGVAGEKKIPFSAIQLLRDYLLMKPDDALKIPDLLQRGGISSSRSAAIIHALGLAGTPQAQQALIGIMNNPIHDTMNRMRAVSELGSVVHPAAGTIDELWRTAAIRGDRESAELANTTLLALGGLSAVQRDIDDKVSSEINARLVDMAKNAIDTKEASLALQAIGNTRDSSLSDAVVGYLGSDSPEIRSAAAYALRNMDDEGSLNALSKMLSKEENPQVKQAVVGSMLNRPATADTMKSMSRQTLRETDDSTRHVMYQYLVKNRERYPDVKETLAKCLDIERSPQARVLLYKGIYSKTKSPR